MEPSGDGFLVTNLAMLQPPKMPTFTEILPEFIRKDRFMDFEQDVLAAATKNLHIGDDQDTGEEGEEGDSNDRDGGRRKPRTRSASRQAEQQVEPVRSAFQPETLPGWEVKLPEGDDAESRLLATAVTCDGRLIIGVGTHSTIWVWRVDNKPTSS
jgi:hypothetical protein